MLGLADSDSVMERISGIDLGIQSLTLQILPKERKAFPLASSEVGHLKYLSRSCCFQRSVWLLSVPKNSDESII